MSPLRSPSPSPHPHTCASGAIRRLAMARRSRANAAAASARRVSAVSAAAVLVVALGVGGWLLTQSRGTADKTDHSTALRAAAGSDKLGVTNQAGASGAAAGASAVSGDLAAAPAASSTTHSYGYAAGEIGEYHDMHALADKARQDLAQSDATKAQHRADGSPCPLPPGSEQLWTAHVTYNGKDAAAWVRTTQTGRVLEVLDVRSACAVVESQAI
jgi:hypothetical protein